MPRNFPHWLKAYIDFTRDSEAPTTFHFWTGVSTIAGALRRRVWIDMRKFDWTPNFYIILVGPPGIATKSTSIGNGMRLLNRVPNVAFGPESMTWQGLADGFSNAINHVKYTKPDGSEGIMPMSCLTITAGELGTFLAMDDQKLQAFLIRMWEGQQDSFLHKTKSSGNIEVLNPWLNLIGATTPAWIQENIPPSAIGGGLTSRIIFVYGDKKRFLVPWPDEVIQSDEYKDLERKLLEDLIAISKLCGPYQLTREAREWGRQWYADHNDPSQRASHLLSSRYSGFLARKQTHMMKFAIILAAAQRDQLLITESDLQEAEKIITSTEPAMIRVFEQIGVVDENRHLMELVSFVRNSPDGFVSGDDIWACCRPVMRRRDFDEAMRQAVGLYLSVETRNGKTGVALRTQQKKAANG